MSTTTTTAASATAGPKPQGGILEGANPIEYDPKNPISLFIIQATIIIIFCRLLHYPLSKLAQPRVIAEVIGGILLGPSVMMRIPGFKSNIFPDSSMPALNNVANLGLLLFLFLIGLEVDTRMFRSNWKVALSVGMAGMLLPFGMGWAIAWGLYNQFRVGGTADRIQFGTYGLFIGTALAITAFPVLCRILTELRLLRTSVGVTVLAAGIGNDVTGWVLLALAVALVNNGNGLTALYVFLTAVGWTLVLTIAARPAFLWILRRTGSIQNGPSPGIVALTLLLVLVSAWFTSAIGVHPIFGAFLVGLICPHEGGFAIKITEKIEDLVTVLLLPLYFALSGLSTNLGLLDDGVTWGYVVAIVAIAFFGKIVGGMFAAKLCNMLWRESIAIGVLMSCKGLVELIVLNIGLQARILTQRTFTMFVVMALVTTVATTPLAKLVYPQWYRRKVESWRRGEIDWDGNPIISEAKKSEKRMAQALDQAQTNRILIPLRLDTLPGLLSLISLLGGSRSSSSLLLQSTQETADGDGIGDEEPSLNSSAGQVDGKIQSSSRPSNHNHNNLELYGLRLLELTDRTSSVMQSTELEDISAKDAVFSAFKTFASLNNIEASGHIAAVSTSAFAETLVDYSNQISADFLLIPWSSNGSLAEENSSIPSSENAHGIERFHSRQHIDFVQQSLRLSSLGFGIYIGPSMAGIPPVDKKRLGPGSDTNGDLRSDTNEHTKHNKQRHKIFLPFIGGQDDQSALLFVLQLAQNVDASISIIHLSLSGGSSGPDEPSPAFTSDTIPLRDKPNPQAVARVSSERDFELLDSARRTIANVGLRDRVSFVDLSMQSESAVPDRVVELMSNFLSESRSTSNLIVVGRHHAAFSALESDELSPGAEFQRTVGILADRLVDARLKAGILIMGAAQA